MSYKTRQYKTFFWIRLIVIQFLIKHQVLTGFCQTDSINLSSEQISRKDIYVKKVNNQYVIISPLEVNISVFDQLGRLHNELITNKIEYRGTDKYIINGAPIDYLEISKQPYFLHMGPAALFKPNEFELEKITSLPPLDPINVIKGLEVFQTINNTEILIAQRGFTLIEGSEYLFFVVNIKDGSIKPLVKKTYLSSHGKRTHFKCFDNGRVYVYNQKSKIDIYNLNGLKENSIDMPDLNSYGILESFNISQQRDFVFTFKRVENRKVVETEFLILNLEKDSFIRKKLTGDFHYLSLENKLEVYTVNNDIQIKILQLQD